MSIAAIAGRASVRSRHSLVLTALMALALAYFLVPLAWVVIAATKTDAEINQTFGLAFAGNPSQLFDNIANVFSGGNGIFVVWLRNTIVYAVVSSLGAALTATAAGYALAKFDFPGRRAILASILLAVAVPITVLVLPLFLILSEIGIVNNPLAIILPSMVNPFGVYLMWIFATETLPTELMEAARLDGASELAVFGRIALPLLAPGFVTVLLFSFVATWNNYFLPRVVLSDEDLYPLAIGLAQWNEQATGAGLGGGYATYSMVITGSLVAVVPLLLAFVMLQRYWESGLTLGGVK